MEKVTQYTQIVHSLLKEYAHIKPVAKGIDTQLIADEKSGHFLLMNVGWNDLDPVYSTIFHIDIKDGKVWVQQDWTDVAIAEKLVEKGIPKSDIVLGFLAPYKRKYSEFAEA